MYLYKKINLHDQWQFWTFSFNRFSQKSWRILCKETEKELDFIPPMIQNANSKQNENQKQLRNTSECWFSNKKHVAKCTFR